LILLRDKTGVSLNGQSLYRLQVPNDVSVSQLWSATVYGMKTKAFFANADRVSISSSQKSQLKMNVDGTVDIYFDPLLHVERYVLQPPCALYLHRGGVSGLQRVKRLA